MTVVKIVMAPTAVSPPYLNKDVLKQTAITLSVNCMMNGEIPNARQGRMICDSSRIFSKRIFKIDFFPHRKATTQIEEIACEIIVAKAAPLTPMLKVKIKIGSRIIFQDSPDQNGKHARFRKTLSSDEGIQT